MLLEPFTDGGKNLIRLRLIDVVTLSGKDDALLSDVLFLEDFFQCGGLFGTHDGVSVSTVHPPLAERQGVFLTAILPTTTVNPNEQRGGAIAFFQQEKRDNAERIHRCIAANPRW